MLPFAAAEALSSSPAPHCRAHHAAQRCVAAAQCVLAMGRAQLIAEPWGRRGLQVSGGSDNEW